MTDITDNQSGEDSIRRDSSGAIDYRYYLLQGRKVRAETAWSLVRSIFGRNRKDIKNRQ
ncbi:hypothetical protein [Aliamphritea spongicola]|uniref:hypothetical protein n=1 Tax=Aliamphritea spongicola TaxID=707589 RepID=UPI00196A92F1|nr:hypothetical protein [Aliamphritea spongicola]MBN3564256.1 hypothetical protein [Aliamphritea spongicola]